MRAVIQRVSSAEVRSEGQVTGKIGPGAVVLLGVERDDSEIQALQLADKTAKLRIFEDPDGKMNLSLAEVPGGKLIVVSQFTLHGDVRKGNRPSFIRAAGPDQAEPLYQIFVGRLRELGFTVETGVFRTMMEIALVNDGPVTLVLDTNDWA